MTGGPGVIGSALIHAILGQTKWTVLNLDKRTYGASPEALASVDGDARYRFGKVDICDAPDGVVHLAAELHVDCSLDSPAPFVRINMFGTYQMLEVSLACWDRLLCVRCD